jgi:hypothetical protein
VSACADPIPANISTALNTFTTRLTFLVVINKLPNW